VTTATTNLNSAKAEAKLVKTLDYLVAINDNSDPGQGPPFLYQSGKQHPGALTPATTVATPGPTGTLSLSRLRTSKGMPRLQKTHLRISLGSPHPKVG
jgi:hypothetical protein